MRGKSLRLPLSRGSKVTPRGCLARRAVLPTVERRLCTKTLASRRFSQRGRETLVLVPPTYPAYLHRGFPSSFPAQEVSRRRQISGRRCVAPWRSRPRHRALLSILTLRKFLENLPNNFHRCFWDFLQDGGYLKYFLEAIS